MSALSYNQRKYTVCVCFYIQSSLSLGIYLGTVSVLAYVWTFSLSPSFDPEALVQLKQTRTPPVSCPIPGCSLEHQSACCPSHQRSYSKRLHLYSHMVQRSTKRNIRRDSKCAIMVETGTFVKQHWKKTNIGSCSPAWPCCSTDAKAQWRCWRWTTTVCLWYCLLQQQRGQR